MAIRMVESFSWVDATANGLTALNTRYNSAGSSGIVNGGGRFAGNCLRVAGAQWVFNYWTGAVGPNIVWGFALRSSQTVGTADQILVICEASSNEQCSLDFSLTGLLRAKRGGTILGVGTRQLQANSYYYIEVEVFINAVTGSFKVWIDGVQDINLTNVNTQAQATNQTASAILRGGANHDFCDMYMKDTLGPLGPRRVSLKMPTANGGVQQWTPSAGSAFQRVNTIPPNLDANGYISDNTPGDNSSFVFGALPYVPATVDLVQVSLYSRFDDGGPHQVATMIRIGGVNFVGAAQTVSGSYLDFYLQVYALNPSTALAWTAAQVDAAEYGVNLVL